MSKQPTPDTSTARAEILSRIRSITGTGPRAESAAEAWQQLPRNYRQQSSLQPPDCVELLEDRLCDYGAGIYHANPSEIAVRIGAILSQRNKRRMAVPFGIDPAWLPSTCVFVPDDALSYQALDACDGVLTGCTLAIAATGTLALCHGTGPGQTQGRRALSLIPDYHLCIVARSSVVETVPEAMHLLEAYRQQPITLISGPSATADIEMTRIQGVHGPRVLDVVLVG